MIDLTRRERPDWLPGDLMTRLEGTVARALRRARATGSRTLMSVGGALEAEVDPSAVVAASRAPGEPWFCLEQPAREGSSLAALGCLTALEARGPTRFQDIARRWRAISAAAVAGPEAGPPGSGLIAIGGFAFAADGGDSRRWRGFAPGSLIVPEVSLARRAGVTWLSANASIAPDDTAEDVLRRVLTRLAGLEPASLPLVDPAPSGRYEVHSPMPPAHYEEAVRRAVQRIRAGELEKIVLAREVEVHAPTDHDAPAVLGLLREEFPACFVFAVGRGDATFVAASPELLVRRDGQRVSTVALAGSMRRSADPAVDEHLGEQLLRSAKDREENAIVVRRIASALRPYALWIAAEEEPVLVQVANIQHLATPIRAQLAEPMGAIELAGLLHPTPAVGAEPAGAVEAIPALEGFDRGWYAGTIGWTDAGGDGEFCVALRCALLRGRTAHCFAGGGIVRDSDPAAELAETEVKLQAMLPALVG